MERLDEIYLEVHGEIRAVFHVLLEVHAQEKEWATCAVIYTLGEDRYVRWNPKADCHLPRGHPPSLGMLQRALNGIELDVD